MNWLKGFLIGYGIGLAVFSSLAGFSIHYLAKSGLLDVF